MTEQPPTEAQVKKQFRRRVCAALVFGGLAIFLLGYMFHLLFLGGLLMGDASVWGPFVLLVVLACGLVGTSFYLTKCPRCRRFPYNTGLDPENMWDKDYPKECHRCGARLAD